MSRKIILLVIAFAFMFCSSDLVANAQSNSKKRPERESNGGLAEYLKDKVSLPNLPEFTGKAKFTGGIARKSDYGQSYVLRFDAKEDPKLVLDWYKNTLNMYKWKITFADDTTCLAKLDGTTCAIAVNSTVGRKTGNQSEIEINYFQAK